MSKGVKLPSTEELKTFIRIHWADKIVKEGISESMHHHYVFEIKDRPRPASVPMNRKEIKEGTLRHILDCAGMKWPEYCQLNGNKKSMKQFVKNSRSKSAP